MDQGQPDDSGRRKGSSLSEEARRSEAGGGDFLEEIRKIARGDDKPVEPFTLKMRLAAGMDEAYRRAEERAERADELAIASAQREAHMEEMAIAAAARERAAEERDARRERREEDPWATIVRAVFAFVAAIGTVVGNVIAIVRSLSRPSRGVSAVLVLAD